MPGAENSSRNCGLFPPKGVLYFVHTRQIWQENASGEAKGHKKSHSVGLALPPGEVFSAHEVYFTPQPDRNVNISNFTQKQEKLDNKKALFAEGTHDIGCRAGVSSRNLSDLQDNHYGLAVHALKYAH